MTIAVHNEYTVITDNMELLIKTTVENRIGTIAFDHYQKRNALSKDLVNQVLTALDNMEQSKVNVVILRQDGWNSVWSAGHDVDELPVANEEPLPFNDPLEKLLRAIRKFPAPVIAMVHGSVWGGAFDLVLNCDMVIADETSTFAITPAKLGLPYNASGIQHFLARLPVNIVNELFFTALPLNADRAFHFNLVNEIVPKDQLEQHTYDLAKTICSRSSQSIAAFKEQAKIILGSCAINPEVYEHIQQVRRDVYHGTDYNEGVSAFLEKRKADFNKE